jgi:hypothetical protein
VGGEHYILGTSHSAAIVWNVDAIRIAFHQAGRMRQQQAMQIIEELQAQ